MTHIHEDAAGHRRLITQEPVHMPTMAQERTFSISTVWGFLENFGLVARVDSYWVAVIWFMGFGFGGFINWMSYRARGDGS